MRFLAELSLRNIGLMLHRLTHDLIFQKSLLVILLPLLFSAPQFLGHNILMTAVIDLPEKRDARIVLLTPAVFFHLPLLLGLVLGQVLDELLIFFLVLCLLEVGLLEFNDFVPAAHSLFLL